MFSFEHLPVHLPEKNKTLIRVIQQNSTILIKASVWVCSKATNNNSNTFRPPIWMYSVLDNYTKVF